MNNYIFNEKKLYWEIKATKEKYKEIYWVLHKVEYNPATTQLEITLVNQNNSKGEVEIYYLDVASIKCLRGKTEEEIVKVSLLGERDIQWKELDIKLGLEKLLMSVQLLEEWVKSLK